MKLFALALFCLIGSALSGDWGYEDSHLEPEDWSEHYPDCGGSEQSPIDLKTSGPGTIRNSSLATFAFADAYAKATAGNWVNNGHTVMFTPVDASGLRVSGGPYGGNSYQLLQVHLHWGCTDNVGSEHAINGKLTSMEMHLVHWKTAYGSSAEALKKRDGLGVIGLLFDVQQSSKDDKSLKELNTLVSQVANLAKSASTGTGQLTLANFWPKAAKSLEFFTYDGSLTTPGCNEVVKWTVLADKLPIQAAQLSALRKLMNSDGEKMCNNYRPVQPIGARKVVNNVGTRP